MNKALIELLNRAENALCEYQVSNTGDYSSTTKECRDSVRAEIIAFLLATPATIPDAGGGVLLGADNRTAMVSPDAYSVILEREKIIREGALQASAMVVPDGAVLVGRAELSLVRNAMALDAEQGRPVRGEMLIELDASISRFDAMLAASPALGGGQ